MKAGPGIAVMAIVGAFGTAIFPPFGLLIILALALAGLVKWINVRARKRAHREHIAKIEGYYVADQQRTLTEEWANPGWWD